VERTAQDIYEVIKATPFPWSESVIHAFYSGSAMHGATGNKPSDTDIAGVYIQPPDMILGIPQMRENEEGELRRFDPDTQVWKTQGDHGRSGEGDIDLSLYSLRKWAGMAASGNTTALEFMFVRGTNPSYIWLEYIVGNYPAFLSKHAGHHFIAFAKAMLLRLNGGNTGRHGQRPELEQEFGYDTKGAMHMLRVLGEGMELMTEGRITLPCPEAPYLKDVRNGKYTREEVNKTAEERFALLEDLTRKSALPDELDRAKISRIITKAQLVFWGYE
jgi:predicted nucleotidyltransferase